MKVKIQVKKEMRCYFGIFFFLEGNRVIFALISFSLATSPKESIYNFKTRVSNTNLLPLNRL